MPNSLAASLDLVSTVSMAFNLRWHAGFSVKVSLASLSSAVSATSLSSKVGKYLQV